MKLLLSSIVLVTLTVFAQSSVDNESNLRVLKSAKGSKTPKSVKSVKVQKSMKSDKAKAAKSEKAAKADESKSAKVGVEGSKTPKGKGGGTGGEGKAVKSAKDKSKSGVPVPITSSPTITKVAVPSCYGGGKCYSKNGCCDCEMTKDDCDAIEKYGHFPIWSQSCGGICG